MRKPALKFRVGDTAVMPYGVHPPAPAPCIPAESQVTILDSCLTKYGRGAADYSEPRYKVRWAGIEAWTYESELADAREGMEK